MSIRWVRVVSLFLFLLAALSPLATAQIWEVRDGGIAGPLIPPSGTVSFPDVVSPDPDGVDHYYYIRNLARTTQLLSGCQLLGDSSFSIFSYPYAANEPGAQVFPGQSVQLGIRHVPNAIGTQQTIVNCGGGGPVYFTVQGRVLSANPYIILQSLNGSSLGDFGSTPTNIALPKDFRILNFGNQPLSISSFVVTGAAFSPPVTTPPSSIPAGGEATFRLRLLSSTPGAATGQLQINNNDPNHNPYVVNLSGTVTAGPGGQIRIRDTGNGNATVAQGSQINIGTTTVNTPLQRTFWIDNLSEKLSLTISNPTSFLSGDSNFSVVSYPASSVAPGGSTSFTVQFQSAFLSTYNTTVSLASNDTSHSPYSFTLRAATAAGAEPHIRVVNAATGERITSGGYTVDFGIWPPGQAVTQTFNIINDGQANLSLTNLGSLLSGTGYTLLTSPASSVAPGGQTSFSVRFTSASTGNYYGSVLLYHNDQDEANPLAFSLFTKVQVTQPTVTMSTPDSHASEAASDSGLFILSRTGSTALPLTVQVALTGTAVNGGDYASIATSQTFPAGQSTLNIAVQPINDSTVEDIETATLTLLNSSGNDYVLGGAKTGTVSIYNDDYVACATGGDRLCLRNGRFEVHLSGDTQTGHFTGQAIPLNDSTGGFWLFSSGNIEVGVKVLLAPDSSGYWVYHGAATDVSYTFTVTDRANPSVPRTYSRPAGTLCGGGDVGAFLRSVTPPNPDEPDFASASSEFNHLAASSSTCVPNATTSCLLNGRFQVRVSRDSQYQPLSQVIGETAFFWFFSPDNLEVFVKVLDGTAINLSYWVYFGSMTGEAYQVEVLDTLTGASKTYTSAASGPFCGQGDSGAFPTTP
jgi:hypothetical protein